VKYVGVRYAERLADVGQCARRLPWTLITSPWPSQLEPCLNPSVWGLVDASDLKLPQRKHTPDDIDERSGPWFTSKLKRGDLREPRFGP
jgi:hypothetical protein